jgi:hypothetical protein
MRATALGSNRKPPQFTFCNCLEPVTGRNVGFLAGRRRARHQRFADREPPANHRHRGCGGPKDAQGNARQVRGDFDALGEANCSEEKLAAAAILNERGRQLRWPYFRTMRLCSRTSALYRSIWPASLDQLQERFLRTSASVLVCVNFIRRRHSAA